MDMFSSPGGILIYNSGKHRKICYGGTFVFEFERYSIQETVEKLKSNDKRGHTSAEAQRHFAMCSRNEMKSLLKRTMVGFFWEQMKEMWTLSEVCTIGLSKVM